MDYASFDDYLKRNLNVGGVQKGDKVDPQKPIELLHKMETEERIYTVVIDSRHRNMDLYYRPNHFTCFTAATSGRAPSNVFFTKDEELVPFQGLEANNIAKQPCLEINIKNVKQIRLEVAIVPDFTEFYPYLTLNIDELQDVMYGTSDGLRNAFAVLTPDRFHYATTDTNWVACRSWSGPGVCEKTFDPPLSKLPQMTMSYLTPTGELMDFTKKFPDIPDPDFPLDDSKKTRDPLSETVAIFSVCCVQPSKKSLTYQLIP